MKILFLGHSLVEFFNWQRELTGHEVVNLGIAGETTDGLSRRLDGIIAAHPVADALLVMTGTNDLLMDDTGFLDVYSRLVEKLAGAYPGARIVIHTILPLSPEWLDPSSLVKANEIIRDIARRRGVELLDLHDSFLDGDGKLRRELFTEDGVHLGDGGYRIWADAIETLLKNHPAD